MHSLGAASVTATAAAAADGWCLLSRLSARCGFEPDAHKKSLESEEARRERLQQEQELAQHIQVCCSSERLIRKEALPAPCNTHSRNVIKVVIISSSSIVIIIVFVVFVFAISSSCSTTTTTTTTAHVIIVVIVIMLPGFPP